MIIFGVCQYRADEYFVAVVVDRCDQSEFVAADIEHRQAVHVVGTGERRSQIVEVGKNFAFHGAVPCLQRVFGIWVFRPEFNTSRLGNDVHG